MVGISLGWVVVVGLPGVVEKGGGYSCLLIYVLSRVALLVQI